MTGAATTGRTRSRTVLGVLASLLALLAFVKFFAADVYRVKSGSMRPTIMGGEEQRASDHLELSEWVLVNYVAKESVERFDLVVLEGELTSDPLVKRVAGLPGEDVALVGGDLLVRGERLPADAPRPAPVLMFDDTRTSLRESFLFSEPRWQELDDSWRVDASLVGESNYAETLMQFRPDLTDGYLRSDGVFVQGSQQVNDGVLALEARAGAGFGEIVLELIEEGDLFRAEIQLVADGANLRILRRNDEIVRTLQAAGEAGDGAWEILREDTIDFTPNAWHSLRFANIDNHLLVRIDGLEFVSTYSLNVPVESIALGAGKRSIGTRVRFGADGLQADFRKIRIYRDLYWTSNGEHAIHSSYVLGPDELFLLGDNSSYSTDSRTFGAVPLRELLGRPVAVVWPPRRARRLSGARK